MFNAQQTEAIHHFADTHSILITTVERLASDVLKGADKPIKPLSGKPTGRKASAQSVQLDKDLREFAGVFKEEFVSADMATRFNADGAYVANALSKLEREGLVKRTGKRAKAAGTKGKPFITWQFI